MEKIFGDILLSFFSFISGSQFRIQAVTARLTAEPGTLVHAK
ncbi:Uncharacterized protein dnm_079420 [Desulfonema magnum]|uniref:Uncharacterized protein n=1 Tax=Desulfonema magnum TaxID=45655 RepID=A0A975BUH1_9BACT|nr:Uncharacterized protein dnm_079420 [Desulfonema magnum]